jgi:hypothetical protein
MKLVLAVFIYFTSVYHPAFAGMGVTADEEVRLVPNGNGHEQSAAAMPASKAEVLSEDSLGQMLYENHCTSCHESLVYIRAKRKAANYKEVGDWVNQFAGWLNLGWTKVEKREVMHYLNERYYKFPLTE